MVRKITTTASDDAERKGKMGNTAMITREQGEEQLQVDPAAVISRATIVAQELAPIIDDANLYSMIGGRKYVRCEGWLTMLAMLGVSAQIDSCTREPEASNM